jgi:hypothetical protein
MTEEHAILEAGAAAPARSIAAWVRDHDERWTFVVLYLGLAIGLTMFVSLFWLVAVAGLHFALELYRQAHAGRSRWEVVGQALWEVKLDVGLVLLALTLVLYIDMVLGLLGLQSAARAAAVTRAGARLGSRAAAWERNIRTFLLTIDEMVRVAHAAVMVRKRGGSRAAGREIRAAGREIRAAKAAKAAVAERVVPVAHRRPSEGWRGQWGTADWIGLGLVVAGILLMLLAPFLTPHDAGSATAALLAELRPIPPS